MVLLVIDDPNRLDDALRAWETAGVSGITILESTGLHRRKVQALGARYAFGFPRLAGTDYEGHYTLLAIVRDREHAEECADVAEALLGALDRPNGGVFAAWPLELARGVSQP